MATKLWPNDGKLFQTALVSSTSTGSSAIPLNGFLSYCEIYKCFSEVTSILAIIKWNFQFPHDNYSVWPILECIYNQSKSNCWDILGKAKMRLNYKSAAHFSSYIIAIYLILTCYHSKHGITYNEKKKLHHDCRIAKLIWNLI